MNTKFKHSDLLTILIPLYKRPELTYRVLKNLSFQKCPYQIILADGSGHSCDHKQYIEEFYEFLNIRYIKFQPDLSYSDYLKKMHTASSMIKTKYVITIDNDDFLCVPSVEKCISFLESNEDYSFCTGKILHFNQIQNSIFMQLDNFFCGQKSIDTSNAPERIMYLMENFFPNYYAVYKTELFEKAYGHVSEQKITDIYLVELLIALFMLSMGKLKVLKIPLYSRQLNTVESSAKEDNHLNLGLIGRLLRPNWSHDYLEFKKIIGTNIQNIEADSLLDSAYCTYAMNTFRKPSRLLILIGIYRRSVIKFRFKFLLNIEHYITLAIIRFFFKEDLGHSLNN